MKSFIRNALFGAAGLVVVSLPAYALSSTQAGDTPQLSSTAMRLAQRNENPGGAGYRNENPGGAGFRNENPGGAGYKAKMKHKKKKMKHKKKHKMAPPAEKKM
jgi:hypothetical protein